MKNGFTLAEVLITLGIIGVIFAVTIPSLLARHQKQVTVNRLKQTYTILYQAVEMAINDNGPIETWDIKNADYFNSDAYNYGKEFAQKYLFPYMKVIKNCKYNSRECLAEKAYYLDKSGNTYISAYNNVTYNFVLSNGVVLCVWPRGNVVEIFVDINGKAKPNTAGKDIFYMLIVKNAGISTIFGKFPSAGVYFYGQGHDREYLKTQYYNCAKTGFLSGMYCGALIMLDGWKISKDYPW